MLLQKYLGGTGGNRDDSVYPTVGGSHLLAGYPKSNDRRLSGHRGDSECWVEKPTGNSTFVPDFSTRENKNMQLWPNPATDEITITYGNSIPSDAPIRLRLFDLTGKVIFEKEMTPSGKNATTLSLAALSQGMYIVEMEINGENREADL
ncbi:MAG: T9SS type A sorting domain-containing protein [Chitinophagales bacterium]|nr:T9SS type A sorting domain-containing protein [Chitinophagales bacterium]MDW8392827.1 T9SS type A sorting domain-containing protein [Chitinophagales bacterium]